MWPLWILLAVLPLLPVMATPHAGYMCGVGFAVGVVVGPALAGKRRTVSTDRRPVRGGRWRHVVVTVVLLVSAALTLFYRGFWKGMILAERMTTMPLIAPMFCG